VITRLRVRLNLWSCMLEIALTAVFMFRNPVPVVNAFLEDVAFRCDAESRRIRLRTSP